MPKILDRLVSQLKAKGHNDRAAHAIAVSSLQKSGNLDKHGEATAKGRKRGEMTPAQRAKDRAIKYSSKTGKRHRASDYSYSPKTNRATLKRNKKKRG